MKIHYDTWLNISILCCLCIGWNPVLAADYDCSTPEAAVTSVQRAVQNKDLVGWFTGVADPSGKLTREECVEQGRQSYAKQSAQDQERFWRDLAVYAQAKVLRIERNPIDTESLPIKQVKVWWIYPVKKKQGFWLLTPQHDGWRLCVGIGDRYAISDFSDPVSAYASMEAAVWHGDTLTVFNRLASSVRRNRSFDELDGLWKKRLLDKQIDDNAKEPHFDYQKDQIEVEKTDPGNGSFAVKVWDLNKDKSRVSFQTFVKEGEEWKWVPDKSIIWHPDFVPDNPVGEATPTDKNK